MPSRVSMIWEATTGASIQGTCIRLKIICARFLIRNCVPRIAVTSTGTSATKTTRNVIPTDHQRITVTASNGCCSGCYNSLQIKETFSMTWINTSPRVAIWTSDRTHLEPDLFYLSKETEARLDPECRTTADLVIEVISPGSAIYDRNTKADTYAALGVNELWLVDETEETIERRTLAGDLLKAAVISGLTIEVTKVFAD